MWCGSLVGIILALANMADIIVHCFLWLLLCLWKIQGFGIEHSSTFGHQPKGSISLPLDKSFFHFDRLVDILHWNQIDEALLSKCIAILHSELMLFIVLITIAT
jgi:hypothetical protein